MHYLQCFISVIITLYTNFTQSRLKTHYVRSHFYLFHSHIPAIVPKALAPPPSHRPSIDPMKLITCIVCFMDRVYCWGDGLRPIPPDVTLCNDRQLLSHVPSHLQLFVKPVGRGFWGLHPLHYTYTPCTYLAVQVQPQQRRIFTTIHINTTLISNCNINL